MQLKAGRDGLGLPCQIFDIENDFSGVACRSRIEILDLSAHHLCYYLVGADRGDVGIAGDAAVAQHGYFIGNSFDLFDEVGDIDDGLALAFQSPDYLEQSGHVALRQTACWLVENEHAAAYRKSAGDFD